MMLFMDGCEHYDEDVTIDLKWTVNNGCSSTGAGRNGRGINIGGELGKTLPYGVSWVVGYAVKFNTTLGWGGEGQLYQLMQAGQFTLGWATVQSDGTISLRSGNALIANSGDFAGKSFSFHPQTWYYIEFKTTLSSMTNSDGVTQDIAVTMVCRVNGNIVCSGGPTDSNINIDGLLIPQPSANYHAFFNGGVVDGNTTIDDIGIALINGHGTVNDFFGDMKLGALFPIQDEQTDWNVNPPGHSFSTINEQFPDGDISFVYSNNVGDTDNFDWEEINPFAGDIVAVHYGVYARKDDEGTRSFQLTMNGMKIGDPIFPGDTYVYYFVCLDADPNGIAWTQEVFNETTFGFTLLS